MTDGGKSRLVTTAVLATYPLGMATWDGQLYTHSVLSISLYIMELPPSGCMEPAMVTVKSIMRFPPSLPGRSFNILVLYGKWYLAIQFLKSNPRIFATMNILQMQIQQISMQKTNQNSPKKRRPDRIIIKSWKLKLANLKHTRDGGCSANIRVPDSRLQDWISTYTWQAMGPCVPGSLDQGLFSFNMSSLNYLLRHSHLVDHTPIVKPVDSLRHACKGNGS